MIYCKHHGTPFDLASHGGRYDQHCFADYSSATEAELRARFLDHFDWILAQPRPAITALGRAAGAWDANDLPSMSAYYRLADLIDAGVIRRTP